MGLEEAIAELDGVDPDDFASTLQEEAGQYFKAIRNPAYQEGKADAEQHVQSAQEKVASLRKEKKDLESKIEDLEGEQPDVAELRGKYEQKLEDLQTKISDLEEQNESLQEESTEKLRGKEEEFFKERATSFLLSQGVQDREIAELKVEKAMRDGRVKFDEDMNPKVYDPDDTDIPVPLNGSDPHEVFSQTVLPSIPDGVIEDPRPGNTGLGNTGSVGGEQTIKRSKFEGMNPDKQKSLMDEGVKVVD